MRRGIVVSILLALVLVGIAGADEVTANWQAVIIEDFDDPDMMWIVQPSKFIALEDNDEGYDFEYPFEYQWVPDIWPQAMGEPDSNTPGVIGLQASFTRRGYNAIEFIPAEEAEDGGLVSSPIPLPGRPVTIDLWAWGSSNDYYLEIQLQDYRGVVHTVPVDSVNYYGWRNVEMRIPNHIPRQARNVPGRQALSLVKIVLWTRPEAAVSGFHFYMDQIKVLTDMFETPYDGEGLADPEFLEETWGLEQRQ